MPLASIATAIFVFLDALGFAGGLSKGESDSPARNRSKAPPPPPPPAFGVWTPDFSAAAAFAAQNDAPIFLLFTGSDWCHWCKLADKKVFSTRAWKQYAKRRLVTVVVDFPDKTRLSEDQRAANEALAQRFGVTGFPTFVLLDSDASTVLGKFGLPGNVDASSFIARVDRLLPNRPVSPPREPPPPTPALDDEPVRWIRR